MATDIVEKNHPREANKLTPKVSDSQKNILKT